VPAPNYVLQYEPAYHRIWTAYQLLLRREKQEDSLWRWRERTWAEMCWIGMVAALQRVCRRSPASRGECYFRDDHIAGRFLDTHTIPGDWWFEGQKTKAVVQLVPDYAVADYIGPHSELNSLCPDFVLGIRDQNSRSAQCKHILFWMQTSTSGQADYMRGLGESLSQSISCLDHQAAVCGCILVVGDDAPVQPVLRVGAVGSEVFVAGLPRNLWTAHGLLERLVFDLVDRPS